MTDGQILIATWDRICVALNCEDERTARKKCNFLGIKVVMVNGVAHVRADEVKEKFIKFK